MPTLRDSLLADAGWYHRWKRLIRANRAMTVIAEEYIAASPGDKVLDVGCGDGDTRATLGDVDYTGIDLNEDYLRVAGSHSDGSTRFINANVAELAGLGLGPFDVAIGVGLLHHLCDDEVSGLLSGIAAALRPGGRLVTVDPVFDPAQRTTARVLAALDRGRYVRDAGGYQRLVGEHLSVIRAEVRHDLLVMPYSHCIIESKAG